MVVRKAFQFRLKLTKKQARALEQQRKECCWLYNELLAQRKLAYQELDLTLTKYQQLMFLPELKNERKSLCTVHSQVLQNVVDRLDKAFQGFFRRCKLGEKPGFPRFRNVDRYISFCYPQSGFVLEGNQLKLSKVGSLRVVMHRPIGGTVKTCTLRKSAAGAWSVSFSCEVETSFLPANDKVVALDVGIEYFATTSDDQTIASPRFFKKGEKKLAKAQRKMDGLQKGSPARKKQRLVVAKVHEKIRNQRNDFCHQKSRQIINDYQYICVEDLNIQKMQQEASRPLARSIADASWYQFRQFLIYKAEEAGRRVEVVNPAYTSQRCSCCSNVAVKELSQREHICVLCGYRAHRDLNAAQNILALGLDGLGVSPRSPRLQARE